MTHPGTSASQNVYMHTKGGRSIRTSKQMLIEMYDDGSTARVQMVCPSPQGLMSLSCLIPTRYHRLSGTSGRGALVTLSVVEERG
jgi:hypothetical protein